MRLTLDMWPRNWPMREPLVIARGRITEQPTLQLRLTRADGVVGRSEACGVPYAGETPETMAAEIEAARAVIEAGVDRLALLDLLPEGGARNAVDCALWDLEAKAGGPDPFRANRLDPRPVITAVTIGMRSLDAYEAMARAHANCPLLKVKVSAEDPIAAIAAVRRGAPGARLIVDGNQSWTVADLHRNMDAMCALGVTLIEQPIPVGAEEGLGGWRPPVPLCADELVDGLGDLEKAAGRFDYVNIKLDKAGGLTAALRLADAAEALGLRLMVGCMAGSSLSMAPALVLAQRCDVADLDGPLAQAEDVSPGLDYRDGVIAAPHLPGLWG